MARVVEQERTAGRSILRALFDAGPPTPTPQDLLADHAAEKWLATLLKAHGTAIPYSSLRETVERISEETAGHAEALGDFLRQNHIAPPDASDSAEIPRYSTMVRDIHADARAVKDRALRYEHLLRDAPKGMRRVILPIHEDKQRHFSLLVEVALRICR